MYYPQLGDLVRLKHPYRPSEWVYRQAKDWPGFEWGIVVEIVATQFTVNGAAYGPATVPRTVSLHLYDRQGQLYIEPQLQQAGILIPTYVDFHLSEVQLYKIATETGYCPVSEPPDYETVWQAEVAILQEFGL